MRVVRLGEVCKVISGSTPKREITEYWGGDIPWVTPKEISRLASPFLWDSAEKITEAGFKSCSTTMLPVGSLLLSSRAPIGLLAVNKIPVCTNQGFKSLIPSKEVNVEYLYYILKANVSSLQAKGNGATFKELAKPSVENFEIPLPPIDDQLRIAHLLGKVEGLIAQRKQHLNQLDTLLKSVFQQMFGDPVRNEKAWQVEPCEKAVLDISSGTSYGGEERAFLSTEEVGVLKISAVTKGVFDPEEFKVVNPAQITKKLRFVKRGDFLFSRANTVDLVAACCVVPKDYSQLFLPDKLWVLTLNPELVHPLYFNYLLKNERYRDVVRSLASGGHESMLNISMKKFMTLGIPCPLINLQNQFAAIVEKVEGIKSCYQQSLSDLETLYGALSQLAFKGELDLSRIKPSTQHITQSSPEDQSIVSAMAVAHESPTIYLPDLGYSAAALSAENGLKKLIQPWLETTHAQLDGAAFSVQRFMTAAQTRLAELHPETDFKLCANDYESIKDWVFKSLASGTLTQMFDDAGNRVQLKVVQA